MLQKDHLLKLMSKLLMNLCINMILMTMEHYIFWDHMVRLESGKTLILLAKFDHLRVLLVKEMLRTTLAEPQLIQELVMSLIAILELI